MTRQLIIEITCNETENRSAGDSIALAADVIQGFFEKMLYEKLTIPFSVNVEVVKPD